MPCVFVMCVFVELSPQKIMAEGTYWRFLNELKA
jgi:hypothetical protein